MERLRNVLQLLRTVRQHPATKWTVMGLVLAAMVALYYWSGTPALFIGYFAGSLWLALPGVYWITAPDWWRSPTGRALMNLFFSLALLFVLIITSGLFGASPLREVLRIVVYGWVAGAAVRTCVLLAQLRLGADWHKRKARK